jgi:hypothetical protein
MWYYINENQTIGPLNLEDLLKVIDKNTLIWNDEETDSVWKKADLFPTILSSLLQNNNQIHLRKFNHFKYIIILTCFLVGYFFLVHTIGYYYNAYTSEYYLDYSLLIWLKANFKVYFIDYMLFYNSLTTVFELFSENKQESIPTYIIAAIKLIGTLLIIFIWFRNFKKNKIKK